MKKIAFLAALASLAAQAQPATKPAPQPTETAVYTAELKPGALKSTVLIKHGRIHTMAPAGTFDGDVLIIDGRIAAAKPNLAALPGMTVIDAKGKPVTPGLMVSWTQLGVLEIDLVSEGNDTTPNTAFDSAAFDVSDAVNPNSTLIPVARIRGITRSLTTPADCGDVFCGTSAVIDLGLGPDLVDKREAGVIAVLEPTGGSGQKNSRPDIWAKFRETLDDAREYWAQRGGYRRPGGSRDQRSNRIDLEALGPVIQGREPLLVHVERAQTIRQIVAYAQANRIKLVILGGAEAWRVADVLATAHVPVVIDSNKNLPANFGEIGSTLKNAALLDKAGVLFAFQPQFGATAHYARTITQIAGNAVANGLNWDHALAAITRNPAEIFGVENYGTLEPGKDGDVVVWDGDPLDVTSAPTAVFVKGRQMPMTSRQTELRDRYRDLAKKAPPLGYR